MSPGPTLAPDAAIVLGIAATAMPFARTPEDELERWLRLLRLHGEVGTALQALGLSEGPLPLPEPGEHSVAARQVPADSSPRDAVALVTEQAVSVAGERGAHALTTADLLLAVMRVYGDDFDRALRAHGTDRDEVLAELGSRRAASAAL
ncbi:MAG TPA: hypothetical protein VIH92_09060 [Solirubrobacteraceae bacterium]|jgi:hypothetical protein